MLDLVCFWIEKTKMERREDEKKMRIREAFMKEFNLVPQEIDFDGWGKPFAKYIIDVTKLFDGDNKPTILGQRVKYIQFYCREITQIEEKETNDYQYNGSNMTHIWSKTQGGYEFKVSQSLFK